jgi:polyisoprenoid-binding protein YceI
MKKATTMMAIAIFSLTLANAKEPVTDGNVTVNTEKSNIDWKGEKVTGEHTGTIKISNGTLELKDGKLKGGEFVIDMTSLENTDLDGEYKGKLEGHLKSDDFFGVAKFPEATLKIKSVKETAKNGVYNVTADLTIKGITNPITFTATLINTDGVIVANTNIIVDRSKYDVRYGSGSFFDNLGDKTIYDEFTLSVNLVTQ